MFPVCCRESFVFKTLGSPFLFRPNDIIVCLIRSLILHLPRIILFVIFTLHFTLGFLQKHNCLISNQGKLFFGCRIFHCTGYRARGSGGECGSNPFFLLPPPPHSNFSMHSVLVCSLSPNVCDSGPLWLSKFTPVFSWKTKHLFSFTGWNCKTIENNVLCLHFTVLSTSLKQNK